MPGQRLPMRKVRDVLRLRAGGMSKRQIAASLSIGATAAGDCIRRAHRAGLSWPLPEDLSDEVLERILYPPPQSSAKDQRSRPDWPTVHRELRRPGVTLEVVDGTTGEVRVCQLFVAALGASNYTYAEATFTQRLVDWIGSNDAAVLASLLLQHGVTAAAIRHSISGPIATALASAEGGADVNSSSTSPLPPRYPIAAGGRARATA